MNITDNPDLQLWSHTNADFEVSGNIEPSTDLSRIELGNDSSTGGTSSLPQWLQENLAQDAPTQEKLFSIKQDIMNHWTLLLLEIFDRTGSRDYDFRIYDEEQSELTWDSKELAEERLVAHWPRKFGTLLSEAASGSDKTYEIAWTNLGKLSTSHFSAIEYRDGISVSIGINYCYHTSSQARTRQGWEEIFDPISVRSADLQDG